MRKYMKKKLLDARIYWRGFLELCRRLFLLLSDYTPGGQRTVAFLLVLLTIFLGIEMFRYSRLVFQLLDMFFSTVMFLLSPLLWTLRNVWAVMAVVMNLFLSLLGYIWLLVLIFFKGIANFVVRVLTAFLSVIFIVLRCVQYAWHIFLELTLMTMEVFVFKVIPVLMVILSHLITFSTIASTYFYDYFVVAYAVEEKQHEYLSNTRICAAIFTTICLILAYRLRKNVPSNLCQEIEEEVHEDEESRSTMATFVGVLLDVSGSMKESFGERPNEENGSWARSIFKVVDGLIKHDVSSSNHVFALGFGASKLPQAFDLLGTVTANTKPLPLPYRNKTKAEVVEELVEIVEENFGRQGNVDLSRAHVDVLMEVLTKSDACLFVEEFKHNFDFKSKFSSVFPFQLGNLFYYQNQGISRPPHSPLEKAKEGVRLAKRSLTDNILEEILTILEKNGAPRVRKWAKMEVLLDAVERSVACSFLEELQGNTNNFRERFVLECLPETCRKVTHDVKSYGKEALYFGAQFIPGAQEYATRDSVKEVVDKGKLLLSELSVDLVPIGEKAIMDVHKASEILHGGIDEGELSDKRVDELMDTVEPLIYGGTPLIGTIDEAKKLFSTPRFKDHTKMMFIISDGQPGDGNNPPIEELAQLGVTTVCCYITKDKIDNPKRLYSTECETWDEAAKLMFAMSSTITTQTIPRTIFVKRGWSIDITNNETRLFVQVNHPDIIEDVCDLARDVVCCQDALSDLLATVSLDLYINQANQGFRPKQQEGGTCYANASAAVLHLSMKRIVGREGGYPDFFKLRKKMIQKYGEHGANTLRVLKEICPEYRLHCKKVDTLGALTAITAKRPVLARFWLTDPEWDTFSDFYKQNPQGVLTNAILDIKRRPPRENTIGHAVVLTSFNSECLRLMNSWGSDWADGGFFKVGNADVLGLEFVDVFWTSKDLKQSETDAYDRHGPSIAQMISKLQGLQKVKYRCPRCHKSSNVNEFSGNHLEADCPKCYQKFKIKEAGDDLALNMYLLSLSTRGN